MYAFILYRYKNVGRYMAGHTVGLPYSIHELYLCRRCIHARADGNVIVLYKLTVELHI